MSLGSNREVCRFKCVNIIHQFLGVDLSVAVNEEGKLSCGMVEAHFDCVSLALVPVIPYDLELLVCEFFDDLSGTIITAIVNDDYFVVFGHSFKLLVHVRDASSDAVRLIVCRHNNGNSI